MGGHHYQVHFIGSDKISDGAGWIAEDRHAIHLQTGEFFYVGAIELSFQVIEEHLRIDRQRPLEYPYVTRVCHRDQSNLGIVTASSFRNERNRSLRTFRKIHREDDVFDTRHGLVLPSWRMTTTPDARRP